MADKKIFLVLICAFCFNFAFAQVPSQLEQIRIQVWADLDPFPGKFDDFNDCDDDEENLSKGQNLSPENEKTNQSEFEQIFGFAINRTKEIAPFLISGMIYGFNFEYTPYDKRRNVAEYWNFTPIKEISKNTNQLEYKNPIAMENKLVCWVYCDRTKEQTQEFEHWNSVVYPKIKGKGSASIENGFESIKEACSEAAKLAVREYWRTMIKNKPKEISGKLLLIGNPRIYISEGQYVTDLDFFMETDKIIPYTQF